MLAQLLNKLSRLVIAFLPRSKVACMMSLKFLFFVTFTWEWERGETSVLCSASIWVLHFNKSLTMKTYSCCLDVYACVYYTNMLHRSTDKSFSSSTACLSQGPGGTRARQGDGGHPSWVSFGGLRSPQPGPQSPSLWVSVSPQSWRGSLGTYLSLDASIFAGHTSLGCPSTLFRVLAKHA